MSNEHNNGPAVPQGEPVAAWLKAKIEKHALLAADCPGSSSVVLTSALLRFLDRLPPVAVPASTGMHWTENEPVRLPASRAGRVYLAGPMTGLPELNFPAFTKEAERLRDEGLQVLNPADHGIVDGADWADYLRHDIAGLASCERIHLLRGWSKSKGANLEATIAKALGMTVTYQVDAEMDRSNAPAQEPSRPQNCGTSYCSCIECVCEPAQEVGLTDDGLIDAWNSVEPDPDSTENVIILRMRAVGIAALRAKGGQS